MKTFMLKKQHSDAKKLAGFAPPCQEEGARPERFGAERGCAALRGGLRAGRPPSGRRERPAWRHPSAVTLWGVTNHRMDVTVTGSRALEIRGNLERIYPDVLTAEVIVALEALAPFDADRKAVMAGPIARRAAGARDRQP